MSRLKAITLPFSRSGRRQKNSTEPGHETFSRLRLNLTLWYCAVLGGALLLFCVVLYFSVQETLFAGVQNDLVNSQAFGSHDPNYPGDQCFAPLNNGIQLSPDEGQNHMPFMSACYYQNGQVIQGSAKNDPPATFLVNTLAISALDSSSGTAMDTVQGANGSGTIYRYAKVIENLNGNSPGVIVVGEYVDSQVSALHILLLLMLLLGAITLGCAALGGLLLAGRALIPARMAWRRQQQFIADAAHELRTPLTLLRADAEVLLRGRGRFDADDAALLEDIVAESTHMSTLANSMLTLARLDAGPSHKEDDIVNLSEIAEKVLHRASALAGQKNVTLKGEMQEVVRVIGDSFLLEQALMSIVDNAIKYNREGGHVTIQVNAQDGRAQLMVADSGIGIEAEHLAHLGERFYRVDKARTRATGGTGLGLSIAQSIIAAHRGTLNLTSTPGEGTAVLISLPLVSSTIQLK